MAEAEITQEEVRGIDLNQVSSIQLKDGTVVVVQPDGEYVEEQAIEENVQNEQFAEEEVAQDQYDEGMYEEGQVEQSNQLRA